MFKKYLEKKSIRYLIVGGVSYILELVVLLFLLEVFNLHRTVATGLSFWFSIITSFYLQKVLVFSDIHKDARKLTKQGTLFFALVMFNYLFTLLVVSVVDEKYIFYSRTLALAIVTIWNFFIYKRLIFISSNNGKFVRGDLGFLGRLGSLIKKHWLMFMVLSIPVAVFNAHYLLGAGKIIDGDFDYYAQMYEAFRISVLDFKQFPSWNPWMAGGMPLFTNPQFGLISIQSPLVLLFGTVYGLKLAYFFYALVGFWGMFLLCRKKFGADRLRSALLGYLWVFCGFFVGHNISHFTFTSFYLLPLVLLSIHYWRKKWGWIFLGVLMSVIVLSSLHYAFLIISLSLVIYLVQTSVLSILNKSKAEFLSHSFVKFLFKSGLVFVLFSGYRVITTYLFVHSNARPSGIFNEPATGIFVNLKALFLPIISILPAPMTQYGWGEYSAYMGFGVSIVFMYIVFLALKRFSEMFFSNEKMKASGRLLLIASISLLAFTAFAFSLGDFGLLSPFNLLRKLPGFSETRVSSRWLIIVAFSILVLIANLKRNRKLVNLLLAGSVIELMLFFGPFSQFGHGGTLLPEKEFNPVFSQFDNGRVHLGLEKQTEKSYYYATSQNIGNIYADDSIVNTLNNVLATSRCGLNVSPSCDLVLTDNAEISYWSPNEVRLKRTGLGFISLNINRERGWVVNGEYIFADRENLDPSLEFIVPNDGKDEYSLIYAPKFSPQWLRLKLQ